MSPATGAIPLARLVPRDQYTARIELHLARLADGHDPFGHLISIERLARAARAEWQEKQRSSEQRGTFHGR
jgi:hypothetical protein